MTGTPGPDGRPVTYALIIKNFLAVLVPLALTVLLFAATWWYIVIHNAPEDTLAPPTISETAPERETSTLAEPPAAEEPDAVEELGNAGRGHRPIIIDHERGAAGARHRLCAVATDGLRGGAASPRVSTNGSAGFAVLSALVLLVYYRRMDGEQLEILKMLPASVVPLGVLTFVVLAVILFGITTATESAGVGALGALYLATYQKYLRATLWATLAGAVIGAGLGMMRGDVVTILVSGSLGGVFLGTVVPWLYDFATNRLLLGTLKQSVFLTAKTTSMVCWLFVGSALFSAVFALHGGQSVIEHWVLGLNLSSTEFMILAQIMIFLLGWPLEWTEIIVIFIPIFIPLLSKFQVDPVLFGTMVAVNLQAAFLSPPVAMSAFYLKGVAPKHVTLNQIFAGMMPYMLIVMLCLAIMYVWPGMTLWLPNFLYGN